MKAKKQTPDARAKTLLGSSVRWAETMHRFLIVFAGLLAWTNCQAESDICFLPAAPKASVSFEGVTQAGKQTHRLEVRQLAFFQPASKKLVPVFSDGGYYIIYYAGPDYGPTILQPLEQGIDPLIRMVGTDAVEIFYLAGAHTHIRELWRLLGHTAKKEIREEIDWRDDPRMK